MKKIIPAITLVTNKGKYDPKTYLAFIQRCAKAGISAVQFREKDLSYPELLSFGESLKNILDPLGIPLIINDNTQLCLDLDASGVHLGQSDDDPGIARKRLGSDKIIGLSVSTKKQIEQANLLPLNYIGVGPIFPTKNKTNVKILGIDAIHLAAQISHHPIISIGGINTTNAADVIDSGSQGIAIIDGIHRSNCPDLTIKILTRLFSNQFNRENQSTLFGERYARNNQEKLTSVKTIQTHRFKPY